MQNKLISVIIPIYNVEKYIGECLQSIMNQTYENLEILCIDDCGTDNSIKIVEEFAKKDERIKIISYGENKGVSFARNYGLEKANGEYIYFIDSDDYIDLDYLEKMIKCAEEKNINVIINTNIISYNNLSNKQFYKKIFSLGKLEINNNIISTLPVPVWCKLYRKSFLDKINVKFPLNLRLEDEFFHYATLVNTDYIYLINNSSYFYRQIKTSFMKTNRNNTFDSLQILKLIFEYYKNNNFLDKYKININLVKRSLFKNNNKKEFFKLIKNFFKQIKIDVSTHKKLYLKTNIIFFYCVLNSNNYYAFKLKYILSKIFKINYGN